MACRFPINTPEFERISKLYLSEQSAEARPLLNEYAAPFISRSQPSVKRKRPPTWHRIREER